MAAVRDPATEGLASRLTVNVPAAPAVVIFVPPATIITPASGVAVPASPSRVVSAATPAASRLIPFAVLVIVTDKPVDVKLAHPPAAPVAPIHN